MVMLYAAITLSIRNWYPSFVVIEDIGTKEQGAFSISLYSTAITITRFLVLGLSI